MRRKHIEKVAMQLNIAFNGCDRKRSVQYHEMISELC